MSYSQMPPASYHVIILLAARLTLIRSDMLVKESYDEQVAWHLLGSTTQAVCQVISQNPAYLAKDEYDLSNPRRRECSSTA